MPVEMARSRLDSRLRKPSPPSGSETALSAPLRRLGSGRISGHFPAPFGIIEYGYYLSVAYTIFAPALGISVSLLGAGMLAMLALLSLITLDSRVPAVIASLTYPLGCAVSLVAIVGLVHGEPVMGPTARQIVLWIFSLILVQSLAFRRKGFLGRFAIVSFMIGLGTVPFIALEQVGPEIGAIERAALDPSVGYANPNELAAWFGFSLVYFAVTGIEARRPLIRGAVWSAALVCLYMAAITVSRGSLIAAGVAILIALRRSLKRSFFPLLSVFALIWVVYESGLFQQVAGFYLARGLEDTRRTTIWALAIGMLMDSPFVGLGFSNSAIPLPGKLVAPHNSFLNIALAGGVLPLLLFLAYWIRAFRGALRNRLSRSHSPLLLPLLTYALLNAMTLNFTFLYPWMIATLATATAGHAPSMRRRKLNGPAVPLSTHELGWSRQSQSMWRVTRGAHSSRSARMRTRGDMRVSKGQ